MLTVLALMETTTLNPKKIAAPGEPDNGVQDAVITAMISKLTQMDPNGNHFLSFVGRVPETTWNTPLV